MEHEDSSSANNNDNGVLADNHMKKLLQSAQLVYSPQALLRSARDVAQELNSIEGEAERWDRSSSPRCGRRCFTTPRLVAGLLSTASTCAPAVSSSRMSSFSCICLVLSCHLLMLDDVRVDSCIIIYIMRAVPCTLHFTSCQVECGCVGV